MASCIAKSTISCASLSRSVPLDSLSTLRTSAVSFNSNFINGDVSLSVGSSGSSKPCRRNVNRVTMSASVTEVAVDVAALDKEFGAEGVKVDAGNGGLPRVTLTSSSGSVAEVYLYGAVATSWTIPSGEDLLFVRPDAVFTGKKPISGGIPHCFPQFGPGVMQQHGFARNSTWDIASTSGGTTPSLTMKLTDNEYTRSMWDFAFEALFTITLGETTLSTELVIKNLDSKPFEFTTALHSYFRAAISDVKVLGLKGLNFLNKDPDPKNPIPGVEEREAVVFPAYVDSVYLGAPSELVLENGLGKSLSIANKGWSDAVVWSPYLTMEACYKDFVCVENAQIDPVALQPGESWTASMVLTPK
eukprot:TRINITY_DN35729_c0_g1_i1.p1 TRINITY_DN35729_c0_g1~~TRINITY_DN35729_c0_g1_i1.p1  ORF type:complete len:359 (+),score=70.41 TRINITY_DN35729_c0_g1_i1:128-1204(+)